MLTKNDNLVLNGNSAWLNVLSHLTKFGKECNPRRMETCELLNFSSCIDMNNPIVTVMKRKVSYNFMFAEAWWILSGREDVESIAYYAPSMTKFSDNGKTFNGAYGPRVKSQIDYVVQSLEYDETTRQAVMTIWTPNPMKSKDIPCTLCLQFLIRDDTLHCVATMRSSDAWIGFIYDIFNFSMISLYIIIELKRKLEKTYKLGNLFLNAGSQHYYMKKHDKIVDIIHDTKLEFKGLLYDPTAYLNPHRHLYGQQLVKDLEKLKDISYD